MTQQSIRIERVQAVMPIRAQQRITKIIRAHVKGAKRHNNQPIEDGKYYDLEYFESVIYYRPWR